MKKRILSFLLSVSLAVSLLIIPTAAKSEATVTFADVTDSQTAVAVECLRLLGVLDGYGDGTFRPSQSLTRAQFCKMVVYAMNGSGELGRYATVTVFPDVKPSHWASSYINMAAKGKSVIAGFADGKFYPERTVTVGQAVTILMRLLGYKDENLGGVWPQSYMAEASTIELTDGVSTDAYAPLTRGQAARLFLNLLQANTTEGSSYVSTIGRVVENEMLISSDEEASDGRKNGLELASSDKIYKIASGKTSNGLLNGHKGTLLLDKNGEVLTFIPDESNTSKVISLSSAKATKIVDITGKEYEVDDDTQAYYNGEEQDWSEVYSWLHTGTSITLYLSISGSVEYVFVGGGTSADEAVVVYKDRSSEGFETLTGGKSDYTIYKNGAAAGATALRKYDVATYSSATNTIRVCDTRITAYYESCTPNASEASKVTFLGQEFDVLPSALKTLRDFQPGDQVTFLLTEDNQVAGAAQPGPGGVNGNAVGIVKSASPSSASVELLCGISASGSAILAANASERLTGQLAVVGSTKDGLTLNRLGGGAGGDLDIKNRTVGRTKLADNAMIFQSKSDGLTSIGLNQLTGGVIPENQITYARTNWAGEIDLLVLSSNSGVINTDGMTVYYGRAVVRSSDGVDGVRTIYVEYGNGMQSASVETGTKVSDGSYIYMGLKNGQLAMIGSLERKKDVPNSAWTGTGMVTVDGEGYTVSDDVPCYNWTTKTWMTLDAAHAYTDHADLYVKDGIVRAIEIS